MGGFDRAPRGIGGNAVVRSDDLPRMRWIGGNEQVAGAKLFTRDHCRVFASEHVAHPIETFSFRFEHGGRALAYSGDTGESPALVELARSADVFLCEAGFPDLPDLPPNLHLCGRQAGEHAARAGAGQLILTHLDRENDPGPNLAGAAAAFGGPVTLAVPGQVTDLG